MNAVIKLVWLTTCVVFATTIVAYTEFSPQLLAVLMLVGPPLIIYMVIRVLKDAHRDNLTFQDWYADKPRNRE